MSLDAYPLVRDWLRPMEERLLLRTGKVDLGQRISTALVRIACEELTLPPVRVDVAPVRTDDSPDEGITSGSNSIEQSGKAQRLACATARRQIMRLAAARFDADEDALRIDEGVITHRGTNRQLDVLALLSELPPDLPVDIAAPSLDRDAPLPDFEPRGLREMVEGRFAYVHDIEREGMLHARIVRPPVTDARLKKSAPELEERLRRNGLHVIRDGSFLAVAGAEEWAVQRASDTLGAAYSWDIGAGLETGDIFDTMSRRDAQRFLVCEGKPMPDAPLPPALEAPAYRAAFERPYTLHGALGPSAAMACFEGGRLEVITHSQGIYFLRDSIADSLGLAPERVVLEHMPGSGCYGHNGADDAAFEAALVARALPGTPILLKYSRADEHGREPVGTAMRVQIEAETDASRNIRAVWLEARGDTHRGRPRAGANRAGPARLAANAARESDIPRFVPEPNMNRHAGLHRNLDPVYSFADKRLVKALVPDLPLRPSALRCLGAPANILAIESMMDEMAVAAEMDPIDYRLRHLEDSRATRVLKRLKEKLAQVPPPGEGAGRGIAYAQYKNSMTRVAMAVDLTVDALGCTRLDRALIVADAGRIVDPDGLSAQLEGGFLQGASWALCERVQWNASGRETLDWDSYPVLRFDKVPEIEVELISGADDRALGAGEASPGPAVAAIANGIFHTTGLRLRRMPFDRDAVINEALKS
ncbi:MAG: molybdopterin-dependent oxidoreductase [Roseobacter sp.]|jgi:CO/xanthine dehydrogenase Mo-binding subunit